MSRFNEHGLTAQQEEFAVAVAAGSSLSDAYRQAYPRSLRWAPETVHEAASRMAASYKVKARTAALRAAAAKASTLEAARVLDEIAKLAHSDVSGIMHPDGRVKLPHELDAATRAAVASFEIDANGRIKYRFWDKNAALEKAARHLGLYEKDNEQQATPIRDMLASLGGKVIVPKKSHGDRQEPSGASSE
ncbi:MAG: terminase small subunit [Accumulibacter sp.]|jgi:hypothetical protein|uniref:terminase small subunit n=1 Tax=Accumulibacter sp. TaxID=2053492 RepID=UPI002FC38DF3